VDGYLPITESGIQIHTSARNRFISIDVYSCRRFDANLVREVVERTFSPEDTEWHFLLRGARLR